MGPASFIDPTIYAPNILWRHSIKWNYFTGRKYFGWFYKIFWNFSVFNGLQLDTDELYIQFFELMFDNKVKWRVLTLFPLLSWCCFGTTSYFLFFCGMVFAVNKSKPGKIGLMSTLLVVNQALCSVLPNRFITINLAPNISQMCTVFLIIGLLNRGVV